MTELGGEGVDKVVATIDYTLGDRPREPALREAGAGRPRQCAGQLDRRFERQEHLPASTATTRSTATPGRRRAGGGGGDDVLVGGFNKDTLTGGGGLDQFVFGEGDTGHAARVRPT